MKNIKTYEEFEVKTFKEYLDNNDIYNISKRTSMYFANCEILNLDGIEESKHLKLLDCSHNKIISLEPIKNLNELEELYCEENKITSLKDINSLKLKKLWAGGNELTSLDGIENLNNLTTLYCSNNQITSLKPILKLTNLNIFDCEGNPIDWVDYVDKKGNTWYIELPKSIIMLYCDKFINIEEYWKFMDKNQPVSVSRKFNF